MGDRVLAIFLGQEGYHFATNDANTKNPNVYKEIPYDDIENEWTYVYYSYSHKLRKVIGFVYKQDGISRVIFDVTHNIPTLLRFVLGGTDVSYQYSIVFS
jgi:protein transport protein SEC24